MICPQICSEVATPQFEPGSVRPQAWALNSLPNEPQVDGSPEGVSSGCPWPVRALRLLGVVFLFCF